MSRTGITEEREGRVRAAAGAVVATIAAGAAGVATADPLPPAPELGERGQYLLGPDLALDFEREVTTYYDDSGEATESVATDLELQLAIDRVMGHRLTLGGFLGFDTQMVDDASLKTFEFGVRGGLLAPIATDVALWPRASLALGKHTYVFDNGGFLTGTTIRVAISVPLLWRPVSRLYLGLAPTYEFDVRRDYGPDIIGPEVSSIALHGLVGAFFHGH